MSSVRPTRVVVYSLRAEDVPTTAHFYRDIIGLALLPHHGHWPAFALGNGAHLVIVKGKPVPAQNSEHPRFPLIAFAVEDLDAAVEHLHAHGIELPWGIETSADSRWVIFRDPAGNLIELAQMNEPLQQ
jgi:glyoxylase I family protein